MIGLGARALALACLLAVALAGPAAAQKIQRIAAVVNDEVISAYDLEQRVRLLIQNARMPNSREARRRLQEQVLRNLIDERLQMQEARRLNVKVSEDEILEAMRFIERQSRMAVGTLPEILASQGIDLRVVVDRLRTQIAWSKVVNQRLRHRVQVSDDEVDDAIARLEANEGKDEYLVSEILLTVDSPDAEDSVRQAATRIADQIRSGARFAAVARQFSQGATAASGGDVGWVQPGQMAPEVDQVLARLKVGQVADPVRTLAGYHVLALRDKRTIRVSDPSPIVVELKQILLPLGNQPSDDEIARQTAQAESLRSRIGGCDDVEKVAASAQVRDSGSLGRLKIGDLPGSFQPVIATLGVDQTSPPLNSGGGIHLLTLCWRSAEFRTGPDREAIRTDIGRRRLALLARGYLRDLRRDAVVEIR